MNNKQKLDVLFEVRERIRADCPTIPTPSVSSTNGKEFVYKEYPRETVHDFGWNNGVWDAFRAVQGMIEEIADFVTVCCGGKGITMTELEQVTETRKTGRVYFICSKCGKECKQEWRAKDG